MSLAKYAQQFSGQLLNCLSYPNAVGPRIANKYLHALERLPRTVYQLEGDIEGEKKLKIVVGGKSRWLWGRRGGRRCCGVFVMFASGLFKAVFEFAFPKHDSGTICALCITLF